MLIERLACLAAGVALAAAVIIAEVVLGLLGGK
jgi:hypothetical protein